MTINPEAKHQHVDMLLSLHCMLNAITEFDAVVVGGGPAGCAAAITLVRAGWSVLLVERQRGVAFRIGESLPPVARSLLHDLGLSAVLQTGHVASYGNESAWGSQELWQTDFIRDPYGHGWRLDRGSFDAALRTAAQLAGAQVWEGVRVRSVCRMSAGWLVTIDQRPALRARWMVDASGRCAWLARSQGATIRHTDRLVASAVCYSARLPGDQDSLTLVEAAAAGWWYSARLPDTQRVVVFHCDAGSSAAHMARSPAGFAALLAQTEHVRLRLARWEYTPGVGPLVLAAGSTQLDPPIGQQWIAVGDAALAFDPLASQGILNALYSGMLAAQTIVALQQGDPQAERRYIDRLQAIYASYLRSRSEYYATERRWADHHFWASRSQ